MSTRRTRSAIHAWGSALSVWLALAAATAAHAVEGPEPVTKHERANSRNAIDAARAEGGQQGIEPSYLDAGPIQKEIGRIVGLGRDWYIRTPASGRMCWGGLAACAALGLTVLAERMFRLRRRRIIPPDFTARFLDRLNEGKLDGGKALDYCEMNPSPAARVALAAVRRWGRTPADLERAVSMAYRVEADRLRRNVGTLRRIAIVAPLLGLLGTLNDLERVAGANSTSTGGQGSWGPAISGALSFLTVGITVATLAIVAYDALWVRIERLSGSLDRLGAETIDAIAMATPASTPTFLAGGRQTRPHGTHGEFPQPAFVTHTALQQGRPNAEKPGRAVETETDVRF